MFSKLAKNILLLLVALLALTACSEESAAPGAVMGNAVVGRPAPDFTLNDVLGRPVTLSQLKGKVIILNLWATWCPPCREEMPSMERLYRQFKDQGLEMLAVNVEENGAAAVKNFLQRTPYSFPILLDTDAVVQNTYKVFRFPETFIIDRNGIIVEKIIGGRNWLSEQSVKKLNFLLNG